MYRSREERMNAKDAKEFSSQKDSWFRTDGFTSTLTVLVTPNGVLAEQVRINLAKGRQPKGTKTRVIEDGGQCTKNFLSK